MAAQAESIQCLPYNMAAGSLGIVSAVVAPTRLASSSGLEMTEQVYREERAAACGVAM